jgi:hypothetical protein
MCLSMDFAHRIALLMYSCMNASFSCEFLISSGHARDPHLSSGYGRSVFIDQFWHKRSESL